VIARVLDPAARNQLGENHSLELLQQVLVEPGGVHVLLVAVVLDQRLAIPPHQVGEREARHLASILDQGREHRQQRRVEMLQALQPGHARLFLARNEISPVG
jgi:hypothetical protein